MKKASSPLLTPFSSLRVFGQSACASSCETILAEKNSVSLSNRCVMDNASTPLSQKGNSLFLFLFYFYSFISNQPPVAPFPFFPSTHIQVHFLPSLVRRLLGPLFWLDCVVDFPPTCPTLSSPRPTFQPATSPCSVRPTSDSAGVVSFEKNQFALRTRIFF